MSEMTLKEFGRLVRKVMKTLPKEFKPYIRNLDVLVDEQPDPEMLRRNGYSEEEIALGGPVFGLFLEFGGTEELDEDDYEEDEPLEFTFDYLDQRHRLIIYKRPHETEFADPRRFRIEVRKTVIHELAHHFGFSEKDLERFDANPDPFGDDPV